MHNNGRGHVATHKNLPKCKSKWMESNQRWTIQWSEGTTSTTLSTKGRLETLAIEASCCSCGKLGTIEMECANGRITTKEEINHINTYGGKMD